MMIRFQGKEYTDLLFDMLGIAGQLEQEGRELRVRVDEENKVGNFIRAVAELRVAQALERGAFLIRQRVEQRKGGSDDPTS